MRQEAGSDRPTAGLPPLTLAIGQQLAAGVVLLPLTAVSAPQAWPALAAALCLIALALLSTVVGYLLYVRLIANAGVTKTLSVTFLVPVFGLP